MAAHQPDESCPRPLPRGPVDDVLERVREAIRGLAFGSITVTVQDGVVVQIDRTERAEFRLLPEFAGGRVVGQDAYVEIAVATALALRVGKFKVPFGLERLQSATALVFVERGLPTNLMPNRDLGVQVSGELVVLGRVQTVF